MVSYSNFPLYDLNKCITNIRKAYAKDKKKTPRILPHFPTK